MTVDDKKADKESFTGPSAIPLKAAFVGKDGWHSHGSGAVVGLGVDRTSISVVIEQLCLLSSFLGASRDKYVSPMSPLPSLLIIYVAVSVVVAAIIVAGFAVATDVAGVVVRTRTVEITSPITRPR